MSKLNITAIKKHALACSVAKKGGRFTRVGQDFINEVEADVEATLRKLDVLGYSPETPVPVEDYFVTGALVESAKEILNGVVAKIIERKVCAQPSVGCTLGRTR